MSFFSKLIDTFTEGVKKGYSGEAIDPIITDLIAKIEERGVIAKIDSGGTEYRTILLDGVYYRESTNGVYTVILYCNLETVDSWTCLDLKGINSLRRFVRNFMYEKTLQEREVEMAENRQSYLNLVEVNAKNHPST